MEFESIRAAKGLSGERSRHLRPEDEGKGYKQDSDLGFCSCCNRSNKNLEEVVGEQELGYEQPLAVKSFFPLVSGDLKVSLDLDKESSLCASFLKSEVSFKSLSFQNIESRPVADDYLVEVNPEKFIMKPLEEKPDSNEEVEEKKKAEEVAVVAQPRNFGSIEKKDSLQEVPNRKSGKTQKFTTEEDSTLKELVKIYGEGCWTLIAEKMSGKNRKQVRERYVNFLKKERSPHEFSPDEDISILNYVRSVGKKWNYISDQLPGRTPIMVKNRYYAKLRHTPTNKQMEKSEDHSVAPTNSNSGYKSSNGHSTTGIITEDDSLHKGGSTPSAPITEEVIIEKAKRVQPQSFVFKEDMIQPDLLEAKKGSDDIKILASQEEQLQLALNAVTQKIIKLRQFISRSPLKDNA